MLPRVNRWFLLPLVVFVVLAGSLVAQERPATAPPAPTADDYARAEKFLAPAVSSLDGGGSVSPA